ncbi:outer membrane beta-barrel family protein [Parapedobacter lycopersici]|uniref:outer membrane beta-barrel family protein n=1 Tax=Parapedobacter lycopersici TaxID=1864939 RepID=UPI00214D82DE|nr:outer membrane beta-barrel family protein [Parapedobacter lycopersici]
MTKQYRFLLTNTIKKLISTTFFFCFLSGLVCAQSIVRGTVVDEARQAVAMATVEVLAATADSTVVATIATDLEGRFEVQLLPASYLLRISFLGYKPLVSGSVAVVSGTADLGTHQLMVDDQLLTEVVINRPQRLVEQRSDRMVVNVENSILADGMTVLEILQRAPGVRVDNDGNITMRGKSGVQILINGKLSYLSEKELALLLKGTQSSSIKSIELITNPSAKFDAAGNAGLINIVMKSDRRSGINGTAHSFAATSRKPRYGGGLALNARHNRWNAVAGYDYSYRGEREYRTFLRQFNDAARPDSSKVSNQYSQTDEPLATHNAKFGIDYNADERLTLGALWTGNFGSYKNLSEGYNDVAFLDGSMVSNALTDNKQVSLWNTQGLNLNLLRKIGPRDHELSANFDYTYADYSADQNLVSDFQQTAFQDAFTSVRRGQTPSTTTVFVGKMDYLHHIGNGQKIEAGWKSSWIDADNNAMNDTLRDGSWIPDAGTSNHFRYREQIHAGYASYSLEREQWHVMAGLRLEHTRTEGHQITADQLTERHYTQLFPNISVAYKPHADRSIQLSYSRRIQRPDYDDLNPFRYYVDAFVFWEGNPYLRPELVHAFELNAMLGSTLSAAVYYTYINDVMTSVLTQLPQQNVTIQSLQNIDGFYNVGVNLNYTLKPAGFWTSINNLNGFNNRYRGSFNGEIIDNAQWSATFNSINTFSFGNGWGAEVIGEYQTPQADGVFRVNAYGAVAAGLMKKLVQERLTVKLAATDIFRTMDYRPTSVADGVVMRQRFNLDSRIVTLSATFRFGQQIQARDRRTGSEDEQQRIRGGG